MEVTCSCCFAAALLAHDSDCLMHCSAPTGRPSSQACTDSDWLARQVLLGCKLQYRLQSRSWACSCRMCRSECCTKSASQQYRGLLSKHCKPVCVQLPWASCSSARLPQKRFVHGELAISASTLEFQWKTLILESITCLNISYICRVSRMSCHKRMQMQLKSQMSWWIAFCSQDCK